MAEIKKNNIENTKKKPLEDSLVELTEEQKDKKHRQSIIRHITLVRDACILLGERLIDQGEKELGLQLIANGMVHDNSKFYGVEWKYLRVGMEDCIEFKCALEQHHARNPHHPEYWQDIKEMSRLHTAEMVCDLFARSTEFGTDLRAFIKEKFLPRYDISINGKSYKTIKEFVDLLLERPFV